MRFAALIGLSFAFVAFAADNDSRDKLTGTWQADAQASDAPAAVWSISGNTDKVHLTYTEAGQKLRDFDCNTVGKECTIKDAGHQAKVSLWYNGPKLVLMETRGDDVVKRRFSVADDGQTLEVEVMPIAPPGKTETIKLKKAGVPVATK